MILKRDYYEVLGVNKNADAATIKRAYRKLAKKYHPDSNEGNASAAEHFKEVNEAYDVLSDEKKRKLYDQFGHAAFEEGAGNYGNAQGSPFGSGFGGVHEERGQNIETEVPISFEEAVFGCDKRFTLSSSDGKSQNFEVHIPAGIANGQSVRLKGKGQKGYNGKDGDLLIKVKVGEKSGYERKGQDVYTTVKIPYTTAVLGGEIKIHTLYGDVVCKIKPGTQSGAKIRLKGKGVAAMNNPAVHGDEYAQVQIEVPTHLSQTAKEKLQEYARACS